MFLNQMSDLCKNKQMKLDFLAIFYEKLIFVIFGLEYLSQTLFSFTLFIWATRK